VAARWLAARKELSDIEFQKRDLPVLAGSSKSISELGTARGS